MTRRRSLSPTKRFRLFQERGGVCHLCAGKIQVGEGWEVEHVIPIALGGDDDDANCMLAHTKCHSVKTRKDLADIAKAKRRERGRFGIPARKGRPMPGSKASGWKHTMSGEWVRR